MHRTRAAEFSRVTDRLTDEQTDRQTRRTSVTIVCVSCKILTADSLKECALMLQRVVGIGILTTVGGVGACLKSHTAGDVYGVAGLDVVYCVRRSKVFWIRDPQGLTKVPRCAHSLLKVYGSVYDDDWLILPDVWQPFILCVTTDSHVVAFTNQAVAHNATPHVWNKNRFVNFTAIWHLKYRSNRYKNPSFMYKCKYKIQYVTYSVTIQIVQERWQSNEKASVNKWHFKWRLNTEVSDIVWRCGGRREWVSKQRFNVPLDTL